MVQEKINIEVVYAASKQQWIIPLQVNVGTTIKEAIEKSNLLSLCPDINLSQQLVGIFSVIVTLDHVVSDGDRIEIYRPLTVDPITRRFERVKQERKK